jgi:hypothetical protein
LWLTRLRVADVSSTVASRVAKNTVSRSDDEKNNCLVSSNPSHEYQEVQNAPLSGFKFFETHIGYIG